MPGNYYSYGVVNYHPSVTVVFRFSYSTPKKLNDLSPIIAKWSPKINNVVSIIEDLIDSSDDDESRNEEVIIRFQNFFPSID